eukprot:scaffold322979_cov31-Tisochrysis_lutea.AAC.2
MSWRECAAPGRQPSGSLCCPRLPGVVSALLPSLARSGGAALGWCYLVSGGRSLCTSRQWTHLLERNDFVCLPFSPASVRSRPWLPNPSRPSHGNRNLAKAALESALDVQAHSQCGEVPTDRSMNGQRDPNSWHP